ncbi:MAG: hypothetical protein ACEQSR_00595 [Candidatus Methylacidiphilales bacterium]
MMDEDKEMLEKRAMEKTYEALKETCVALICKELNCKAASPIKFELFHMFESLNATIVRSFKSYNLHLELRVSLAEYYSEAPTAKSSNAGTDFYFFGHLVVKTNYPKTYIHKETIKSKIEDIFLKQDVDFPNSKKFSKRFQVLTTERDRLLELFQFKPLDNLANFPEMEIELSGNRLLFRNSRKAVSLEEAANFCKLAKTILAVFN